MRTAYQASPWRAATTPLARSLSLGARLPERLGDPSAFFSRAPFIPARAIGAPALGDLNRTMILVNERVSPPAYDAAALEFDEDLVEGVDITRPVCRCKFAEGGSANLGQSCSAPTAGGSGSAQFGAGDGEKSDGMSAGTIALVSVAGVGALFLLGIL